MEFTMGAGGVPAGSYFAAFAAAEPYDSNSEQFGPGVLLKWRVLGGPHDGCEASRIVGASLTPKSNLGKFVVALAGRPIASGESVRLDSFVGVRGSVLVEETNNGGTRVAAFIREQPQPTAQASAYQPQPNSAWQYSPQQPTQPQQQPQQQPPWEQQAAERF